jgi:hypothetical protein
MGAMRARTTIKTRFVAASALLVASLLHAYVPLGFMPASGAPFLLELCPEGLQVSMQAHHSHHSHHAQHASFEHCPFGSAPAVGPISHPFGFAAPSLVSSRVFIPNEQPPFAIRLSRAHPPRGPPALA